MKCTASGMVMINVNVPERYIEDMDKLVNAKFYPNRSELIRFAIRDLVNKEGKMCHKRV